MVCGLSVDVLIADDRVFLGTIRLVSLGYDWRGVVCDYAAAMHNRG